MNKIYLIIFALIIPTIGCGKSLSSSTVTIKQTVPSKYRVEGVKKILILPFTYSVTYQKRGSTLIPKAIGKRLEKNGFFEIESLPEKISLEMDEKLGTTKMCRLARGVGADAAITGKVMAFSTTTDMTEIPVDKDELINSEDNADEENEYTCRGAGNVAAEVSFFADLIDSRSGKVLNHEYYTRIGTERLRLKKDGKKLTSEDELLLGVTEYLTKKFVQDLTPHKISTKRTLSGEGQCENGVILAKKGDWNQASAAWNAVLNADSSSECALYNLGVAEEAKENYDEALAFFEKALKLSPENEMFSNAAKRAKKEIKNADTFKKQMRGR